MKLWEVVLAVLGGCLIAAGTYAILRASLPRQYFMLDDHGCHTPVTALVPPPGANASGAAILLHGLSANRRVMTYLGVGFAEHGLRAYLLDLPGHGDNTDRFSFARAEKCADLTVDSLMRRENLDPKKTVLVGHSMGGAIAIRMADRNPVGATIAISPAPMVMPRRMPANLLVFRAQYDLGALKRQAELLKVAAGGIRPAPEDFTEQRAFKLKNVPYATHTSELVDRRVARLSEAWALQVLFPKTAPTRPALDIVNYRTFGRGCWQLAGSFAGLVGLLLLFPLSATLAAMAMGATRSAGIAGNNAMYQTKPPRRPARVLGLAEQAACAVLAVLILAVTVPLKALHLYQGDYLASALLVMGALLLALNWSYAKRCLPAGWAEPVTAAALGVVMILAAGSWLNWQISDMWLNSSRWLCFAALLPFLWIFCFAEEVMLGPIGRGRCRALRYGAALALRLELWLACVLAYYTLDSGQVLIGVLVAELVIFSIVQRLGMDALRYRTGSATGAAVFGAILSAWFIAAIFPLA